MSLLIENPQRIRVRNDLRKPALLRQPDDMACVSAVTTQILYMTGKITIPDVDMIDTALGRQPNQHVDSNEAYLLLLGTDLKLHSICAFNERKYVQEGLPYLKKYYANRWTAAHDVYFSPSVVEKEQRERDDMNKLPRAYAHGINLIQA